MKHIKHIHSVLSSAVAPLASFVAHKLDGVATTIAVTDRPPVLEALEDRRLMSTYTVTNTNDSGGGSLRQAITDANNHAGADTIKFAIGSGAKTITPSKGLPALGDHTTLDATTQPGYAGTPLIELNGSKAGGADGIKITGTGVLVRGLAINRFGGSGIFIFGKGGNRVAGNHIGTDRAGAADLGNAAHGIIVQSPGNVIGGATKGDRNVISGNGQTGVFLYTAAAKNNTVIGNYVGTDATGTKKLGNALNGVQMESAAANFIGGSGKGRRNVISGNARDGVLIVNAGSRLNVVQGNFIGTDASGTKRLGNGWYGVEVSRPDNVIGGGNTGAGNVVSANGYGGVVLFLSTASNNRVQGNFIGTDLTGTKDLGNTGRGMEFTNGAHDNRVGGRKFAERNVISGNDNGGVGVYSGSSMNLLQGNYIGTTAAGNAPLGNTGAGVMVTDKAGSNFLGTKGAGNVVSGNGQGIVLSSGTAGQKIYSNRIGTDLAGKIDLGNATDGIFVGNGQNQIGGTRKGTGNIISGNGGDGIRMYNSSGNLVRRNIIGADISGKRKLANAKNGMLLMGTNATTVTSNVVCYNGAFGIQLATGSKNQIVDNVTTGNAKLGLKNGW
ncbi:MAG TPA: right-handed parallel beta-helix repeat-containing protein [Tepidisphaeraceae bacterium]|nr:right-handed parallel beta-helix repeat-containing protein [Tepidisphaeraceae bacterium]